MNDPLTHFVKADVEMAVLSGFIFDNNEFFLHEFDPGLFTGDRVLVFAGIRDLVTRGVTADIVTLTSHLAGKVRASEIVMIADTPVSLNLAFHRGVLENARLLREMHTAFTKGAGMCREGAAPSEIDALVRSKITHTETFEPRSSQDLVLKTLDEITQRVMEGVEPGLKTGITRLDHIINGFLPGEFVIIAARPGVGKTSLILNMARNFGFAGYPGLLFSMEMPESQLMQRWLCDVGSVDGKYLFQGRLKKNDAVVWTKLTQAGQDIAGLPVFWDDSAHLTIDKIHARARKAKMLHGIRWIAVDYLQLVSGWGVPGQEGKAEITRQFKLMAKELDLVVIVLSQLNRNIEGRASRAPQMSDLRDAGSIEQDCDIALFPDVPERSMSGTEDDGFDMAKLYIVKTRRGRTGVIEGVRWQGHYFRFANEEGGS